MLGLPRVDPHGDPIPDAEGAIPHRDLHTLLTCPLNVSLTVTRVADQDASFLRFLESHQLKPGQEICVERRDEVADCVSVRAKSGKPFTIGARAASKLLVEVASIFVLAIAFAGHAFAQTPAAPPPPAATDSNQPFEITDNSFLIEEAFNQEAGVFQNIFGAVFVQDTGWAATFTQEWPAPGMRHQLSYTIPFARIADENGLGDIGINYRYQLLEEGEGRPAMSPRLTMLCPTGNEGRGLGTGAWGLQINMPVSKQFGDVYVHGNAGFTWYPSVDSAIFPSTVPGSLAAASDVSMFSPSAGGSVIYRLRPMFNLMLESLLVWQDAVIGPDATERRAIGVLSPGVRGGWNLGATQVILGFAVPVTWFDDVTDAGVFTYFSYETTFR
jgi:hypothetical protein